MATMLKRHLTAGCSSHSGSFGMTSFDPNPRRLVIHDYGLRVRLGYLRGDRDCFDNQICIDERGRSQCLGLSRACEYRPHRGNIFCQHGEFPILRLPWEVV